MLWDNKTAEDLIDETYRIDGEMAQCMKVANSNETANATANCTSDSPIGDCIPSKAEANTTANTTAKDDKEKDKAPAEPKTVSNKSANATAECKVFKNKIKSLRTKVIKECSAFLERATVNGQSLDKDNVERNGISEDDISPYTKLSGIIQGVMNLETKWGIKVEEDETF